MENKPLTRRQAISYCSCRSYWPWRALKTSSTGSPRCASSDSNCRSVLGAWPAAEQPQHVPRDGAEAGACRHFARRHSRASPPGPAAASRRARVDPSGYSACVQLGQQPRAVIGLAADHHAVAASRSACQHRRARRACPPLTITGMPASTARSALHHVVSQRRHGAVLVRRQPAQHRLARMHDQRVRAGAIDLPREIEQGCSKSSVIEALHGRARIQRPRCRRCRFTTPMRIFTVTGIAHGRASWPQRIRPRSPACRIRQAPNAPALHAIAGAAAVEVDLDDSPRPRRRARPAPAAAGSEPPSCMATGCSARRELQQARASPRRIAAAVIISVYSSTRGENWRRK